MLGAPKLSLIWKLVGFKMPRNLVQHEIVHSRARRKPALESGYNIYHNYARSIAFFDSNMYFVSNDSIYQLLVMTGRTHS